MRFRESQFAIMGNIKATFHQVKVLMLRTNPSLPIKEYIMQTQTFVKIDSSCCTKCALNKYSIRQYT